MERSSVQMTVSLPPELYKKAMELAKKDIRSKSELVREALREYISRKERVIELRKQIAKSLEKKGIRSLEDVERMIDEGRA